MVVQLSISNFAIIKHLEIILKPGLNILSGETGAGKSIIINAVNLVLGGRASADLIRTGCSEASVEALFSLPMESPFKAVLTELGFSFDGELLIKRVIYREGRNKIHINGSAATLQMLSRLGTTLISISGQHEHQVLLRPDNHLFLLDDFGGLNDERNELSKVFNQYQSVKEKANFLEKEIRDIGEKRVLSQFQIEEIDKAEVIPGEEEKLKGEKKRLQHAEELLHIVNDGYQHLYERQDSVIDSVSSCLKQIQHGEQIDPELGSIKNALAEIELKLEDAAFALRDFQKTIEIDPHRLEELLERIDLLSKLKRKYGPNLTDVLQFREHLASLMDNLEQKEDELEKVSKQRDNVEIILIKRARALSKKRKSISKALEKAVEKELAHLDMLETQFKVRFEEKQTGPERVEHTTINEIEGDGMDRVEFMIAPNVGEQLKPLIRIASGGELSRIMLALKTILAGVGAIETAIFDEVDSGISGATAEIVGKKLLSLAKYHQVLCITHLPQIACQGETHFLVSKEIVNERTETRISELEPKERVQEIARLLGGREISTKALAHAREMLS